MESVHQQAVVVEDKLLVDIPLHDAEREPGLEKGTYNSWDKDNQLGERELQAVEKKSVGGHCPPSLRELAIASMSRSSLYLGRRRGEGREDREGEDREEKKRGCACSPQ